MPKRCIICGENAEYLIKDTSDYYCKDCAAESFGDVSMLVKVEEQAKLLKKLVDRAGKENSDEKSDDDDSDKDADIQDEDCKRNEESYDDSLDESDPEKETKEDED
jgi:hypothetical protein